MIQFVPVKLKSSMVVGRFSLYSYRGPDSRGYPWFGSTF